uniref:GTP diphosphokinase n=1 Tax=Araucaria cunninghamii TaxID=56994 RepID=A0A0D6QVV6_ARACU
MVMAATSMVAAGALYSAPPNAIHANPSEDLHHGQKAPFIGGLSCLFGSGGGVRNSLTEPQGLGFDSRRHHVDLSFGADWKHRDQQSPVSVLQSPLSTPPGRSYRSKTVCSSHNYHCPQYHTVEFENPNKLDGFRFLSRDIFLRSALGPCVNPASDEEFTFPLEGIFTADALEPYAEELLRDAQAQHQIFKVDSVIKAFHHAEKAHRGQVRVSGDPYLKHCVETSVLLAMIGSSEIVVVAGLLHDTLDDTHTDYSQLFDIFGRDVADLVQGVSRLSLISQLARDNNTASKTVEADRLHTMFLAMMDVRVVLIKLADRLHNMRTLGALPVPKQQRIAKETLEIFAPLANRLGIWSWKAELEDLCFKYLNPQEYQELSARLAKGFREATIMSAIQKLDQALKKANITYYDLCGRPKSLYSIYLKMLKKKQIIDEIHDLCGLRLIVLDEKDCYAALRTVHQLWQHVAEKLKDYIICPKFNGYQSLHTVVCGEDGLPLEIQIRTKEMHQQAEYGVAAHWRYKEGEAKHSAFKIQMVEWARWWLIRNSEIMDTKLRLSPQDMGLRPPCPFPSNEEGHPNMNKFCGPPCGMNDNFFVIMLEDDKMTVHELPPNSTVKQLLNKMSCTSSPFMSYGVTTKEELRPKVNHETVSDPNQKLKMGDLVELTPSISDTSLTEYREEIRRMYGKADECKDETGHSSGKSSQVATLTS